MNLQFLCHLSYNLTYRQPNNYHLEGVMKKIETTIRDIALIAGTRVMLGAGLGLLLADKFPKDQRKALGWALTFVGAVTTIPLAVNLFMRK
jgi:hypothetical protein